MKYTYQVQGMKCAACATKIKNALKGFAESVEVTLDPPKVVLEAKARVELKKLNAAIQKVGDYKLAPEDASLETKNEKRGWLNTYYPLLIIVGVIAVASFAGASTLHAWIRHFIAGIFLVFGSFKLLDLRGFRDAYATYDLLAKYWYAYGYIYPFLELGLGFAFLFQIGVSQALWFCLILMGFSSLGVAQAILGKQKIRCACLGTAFNLPMSTITLVEDLGMAFMAIVMLLHTL